MRLTAEGKRYAIPNIPQVGDYRYAKNLDCSCGLNAEGWNEKMKAWHCDGIYDSDAGAMVCFTCKRCGDNIFYHLRDNAEDYAACGIFDEFEIK